MSATKNRMILTMPSDREILISRVFDAPRELVWQAMTDPTQVVHWWGPRDSRLTVCEMDFRVGGAWRYVLRGSDGRECQFKGAYHEIKPPERLVATECFDEPSLGSPEWLTTMTLQDHDGKTLMKSMIRYKSREARDGHLASGMKEGAAETFERLEEHLARMDTAVHEFVITRAFDAPRELVWRAWTERERLMQWFGPKGFTMTTATLDFRPGGRFHYRLQTRDGKEMWGIFVYREIVPPERIVWVNSFSDKDGGITRHPFSSQMWPLQMLSEATFIERDGKTTVTIKWLPLDATDEERRTFEDGRESMKQGWTGTLDQLAAHLEEMKAHIQSRTSA